MRYSRLLTPALFILWFVFIAANSLNAQEMAVTANSSSDSKFQMPDLVQRAREFRRDMDDRGMTAGLVLVNDWSTNLRGGASSSSFNRYSLDLSLTVDTSKLVGWHGGAASVRFKNHVGEVGGDYVGDEQGFSNIDDVSRTHLYEVWYEQRLVADRVRLKVGKVDANSSFASVRVAADFLNSSMGYSPTILALPTYPEPKPSINVFLAPKLHYQVSAGLFRTGLGGKMLLFEGGRDWTITERELGGRSSFGMWHLTGPVPCFDGDHLNGTQGYYAVAEQALWKPKDASQQKELDAFFQFGLANGDVNRFTRHVGAGVVLQSPFAGRPRDSVGIAATSARFTDEPDAGYQYHTETAIEAYYKVVLGKHFAVAPDVQFIHHPGGLLLQKNAIVLTPRLTLNF